MGESKEFDKLAEKMHKEKEEKLEAEAKSKDVALTQLATIRSNPDLAKMYSESATVGSDNLGGELPQLKVHQTGKSTKNELADGTEPKDGWFFYKPTGEQFETVECHILTISKGFRAPGIEGKGEVFNQILGGITLDSKPFIMYFTGLKLSYLWEFGKAANKYTHAKPMGIPMFALTVKLSTEKKANNFGKSSIVNFEIKKFEDGTPMLITDPGEFQFLKDNVETVEETINALIASKEARETVEETTQKPVKTYDADVNLSDIPF